MKRFVALVSAAAITVGASLLVTMSAAGATEQTDHTPGKRLTVEEAQRLLNKKSGRSTREDSPGFVIKTFAGKCVGTDETPADGTDVVQHDCDFPEGQEFVATGPGPYTTALRLAHSTTCLDVRDRAEYDGAPLQVWTCDEHVQLFAFYLSADGETVSILPELGDDKDMCLDVPDATTENGAQMQIWTCHYINDQFDLTEAQRFTLEATSD